TSRFSVRRNTGTSSFSPSLALPGAAVLVQNLPVHGENKNSGTHFLSPHYPGRNLFSPWGEGQAKLPRDVRSCGRRCHLWGSPLFYACSLLVDDCDQSLLCKVIAKPGKPGVALIGFNSPASSAKHVVMQYITCMPAIIEDESKRELAAYKREEDDGV